MSHTRHLSDEEYVDLVDHALPAPRLEHLAACPSCGAQAADMRALLGRALQVVVPEPSPLFWPHLTDRVRQEVASPAPPTSALWRGLAWLVRPQAIAAGGAVAIALALVVTFAGTTPPVAPPTPSTSRTASDGSAITPASDDAPTVSIEADEAWAVVRSVAEDLAWDDTHAAGISARPGSADDLVFELTTIEQSALARLLEDELRPSGAS